MLLLVPKPVWRQDNFRPTPAQVWSLKLRRSWLKQGCSIERDRKSWNEQLRDKVGAFWEITTSAPIFSIKPHLSAEEKPLELNRGLWSAVKQIEKPQGLVAWHWDSSCGRPIFMPKRARSSSVDLSCVLLFFFVFFPHRSNLFLSSTTNCCTFVGMLVHWKRPSAWGQASFDMTASGPLPPKNDNFLSMEKHQRHPGRTIGFKHNNIYM